MREPAPDCSLSWICNAARNWTSFCGTQRYYELLEEARYSELLEEATFDVFPELYPPWHLWPCFTTTIVPVGSAKSTVAFPVCAYGAKILAVEPAFVKALGVPVSTSWEELLWPGQRRLTSLRSAFLVRYWSLSPPRGGDFSPGTAFSHGRAGSDPTVDEDEVLKGTISMASYALEARQSSTCSATDSRKQHPNQPSCNLPAVEPRTSMGWGCRIPHRVRLALVGFTKTMRAGWG